MKKMAWMIALVICLGGFAVDSAYADPAPPPPPYSRNISPNGVDTMVQMVAEEVIIDVGDEINTVLNDWGEEVWGYRLVYHGRFWMVNQGEETEHLAVRFPLSNFQEGGDIKNTILSVKVNGNSVYWWEDEQPVPDDFSWSHFEVTFPPHEEVEIEVTYTTITQRWYHKDNHQVYYVLKTGSGWYGPIGKGRIILRLPYQATSENVSLQASSPGAVFSDSDVYWEFTNLEPEDDWFAEIIAPDTWLGIVADREKLEISPNNASALFRLAEAIEGVCTAKGFMIDFPDLFEEGFSAAEKLVHLVPDSVNYHKIYVRYLLAGINPERAEILKQEQAFFMEAGIENQSLANSITWELEYYETSVALETAALYSPTPKPTKTATPPPTITPTPTQTLPPTATFTLTPEPPTATSLPVEVIPTLTVETESGGSAGVGIAIGVLVVVIGFVVFALRAKANRPE